MLLFETNKNISAFTVSGCKPHGRKSTQIWQIIKADRFYEDHINDGEALRNYFDFEEKEKTVSFL